MKFVIESLGKSPAARLGQLLVQRDGAEATKAFKTPALMQTTKGGSIPYISAEAFNYISKEQQLLQLTLSTMDQMAEALAKSEPMLSAYLGYPGSPNILLLRDPCEPTPSGGNDRDTVPLFTRRGRESLSAERYMELVASFAPDIYQGLCDADTNAESAKKRVQKSVDRTERFMDYCYEQQGKLDRLSKSTLLAPIVGGYSTYARTQSIKHARQQSAGSYGGYVLEGFHTNGLAASDLDAGQLLPIVAHCIKELSDDKQKPRMMPGAYTPLMTVELIKLGIDIFDTSYAYCAAANFKALTFSYQLDKANEASKAAPMLDITNDEMREDFSPLLSSCGCLACGNHTRAYLHHLYKTNELLGPILLMVHNLHHYMAFFDEIRASMAAHTLPKLLRLLQGQDYRIPPNVKVIEKATLGKGFVPPTAV